MSTANHDVKPPLVLPVEREEVRGAMTYLYPPGTLVYALRFGGDVVYATSKGDVLSSDAIAKDFILRAQPAMAARMSREALTAYYEGAPPPDSGQLFEDVADVFRRHLDLPSATTPTLLAAWVMATYVFKMFTYFPYLAINSPTRGCGKSLLEQILSELAWNATGLQTDPTPASLFRDIDANSSTLILDEIETLRNAEKEKRAALMGVVNSGFMRGAGVPRNERDSNGNFVLRTFDAYSPKVFAGINAVADTVRHRSLEIRMQRRAIGVRLDRFDVRVLGGELQDLRDRLHRFALGNVGGIAGFYATAQKMPLPVGLDDRAKDILEPLFSVAATIGEREVRLLHRAAQEVAGHRAEAEPESGLIMAVGALWGLFEENDSARHVLRTADAVGLFRGVGLKVDDAGAQHLLRELGFESKPNRIGGGEIVRGYRVNRKTMMELCNQYLPSATTDHVTDVPEVESLV